ncbi:MAG: hypothetical protein ACRD10_14125 [Terriglobia bacterium]
MRLTFLGTMTPEGKFYMFTSRWEDRLGFYNTASFQPSHACSTSGQVINDGNALRPERGQP